MSLAPTHIGSHYIRRSPLPLFCSFIVFGCSWFMIVHLLFAILSFFSSSVLIVHHQESRLWLLDLLGNLILPRILLCALHTSLSLSMTFSFL